NINGGNPSPTLYSVLPNKNFCYWNGSTWVDTGHNLPGPGLAGALGGCDTYIYAMSGTGIYRYDGTSQATFLIPVPSSQYTIVGGDIITDCNCNFSILTQQALLKYNPNGQLIATY